MLNSSRSQFVIFALVGLFFTPSCNRMKTEKTSELEQIVAPGNIDCQDFPARKALIVSSYGSHIFGVEDQRQDAMLTLTRLPREYLEFVFIKANAQMTTIGPGQGGLTSWTGDAQGRLPTTISTGTRYGTWNVVNHEMGHASYGYIQRQYSTFENDLDQIYSYAILSGNESSRIQGYAAQNREEFFADLFDEFYCSGEARFRLRTQLPRTFAFANRYLIAPTDGMGFDVTADSDKDGVTDLSDRCPNSKPDATTGLFNTTATKVWNVKNFATGSANYATAVTYNGCQKGQVPSL